MSLEFLVASTIAVLVAGAALATVVGDRIAVAVACGNAYERSAT